MNTSDLTLDYYNRKARDYVSDTRDVDFAEFRNRFVSLIQTGEGSDDEGSVGKVPAEGTSSEETSIGKVRAEEAPARGVRAGEASSEETSAASRYRILDLGCGSGRDSKAFLEMGFDVTAVDGSKELARMASAYMNHPVICATFQEYEPEGMFDGIWACSSLLHLSRDDIGQVFQRYAKVLKPGGCFYASFKYGTESGMRHGRFFTDLDEELFDRILKEIPELEIAKTYITTDVRPGRGSEKWLNVFLRRI